MIGEENLAREFGNTIDKARASFFCNAIQVDSTEEFNGNVEAYYAHMMRHCGDGLSAPSTTALRADAHALLHRAFARKGGEEAAQAEARNPLEGGLRFVLDAMTEQYKAERCESYIHYVLTSALAPFGKKEKRSFIKALMDCIGPGLPEEVRSRGPEDFTKFCEELARAYAASMNTAGRAFRRY